MEVKLIITFQYILLVKKKHCYSDNDIYVWDTKDDCLKLTNADFFYEERDNNNLPLSNFPGFILGYYPLTDYNTFDLTPRLPKPDVTKKYPIKFIPEMLPWNGEYYSDSDNKVQNIKTDSDNQLIGEWIYS